jgi:hypothetical protein
MSGILNRFDSDYGSMIYISLRWPDCGAGFLYVLLYHRRSVEQVIPGRYYRLIT